MKGSIQDLSTMTKDLGALEAMARRCRVQIVRMVHRAQAGHPGGSLSEIDLLVHLYANHLRFRPDDPQWEDRDRFILSKGHASPGLYAVLSEIGVLTEEDLGSYRLLGGTCQGHVDMKWTPGVDFSAGSLGMGLSFGLGCALAARMEGSERRAFVMLGDGELQEGSVWEAAMAAVHHGTSNLKVIVDRNRIQNDDFCEKQLEMMDISGIWRSFGWSVMRIDGHDHAQIADGMDFLDTCDDGPAVLIAETVKGKGVSFMEDNPAFHGAAPNDEQLEQAMVELGVGA